MQLARVYTPGGHEYPHHLARRCRCGPTLVLQRGKRHHKCRYAGDGFNRRGRRPVQLRLREWRLFAYTSHDPDRKVFVSNRASTALSESDELLGHTPPGDELALLWDRRKCDQLVTIMEPGLSSLRLLFPVGNTGVSSFPGKDDYALKQQPGHPRSL